MKKLGRSIFLMLAGIIFLMHGLIAHKHLAKNHSDQALIVNLDYSLESILGYLFHEDLGSGHLENVLPAQPASFDLTPEIEIPEETVALVKAEQSIVLLEATAFGFQTTDSNRGPPALG